MLCKSCKGEVPPKFAHAILVNICPLCGSEIMDAELQVAFKDLKNSMAAAEMYPTEIFDWLKSNYNLYTEAEVQAKIKETENRIVETVRVNHSPKTYASSEESKKIDLDKDGNQVSGPSLQTSEQTNKFFKAAEAHKTLDKQQHFKDLIKQIKKNGSPALLDENGTAGVITPGMAASMGEDVDPVELAELNAAFGNEDINSGLDPADIDYEDEIPSVVMNMVSKAGGNAGMNQRDLIKLQNLQHKSASAKSQIAKTGSVGLIRR